MNIVIDIGHPAHVHYFRNYIEIMRSQGAKFLLFARDKEITIQLLKLYKLDFINRGKGGSGLVGKMKYLPWADLFIYRKSRSFKPDLFISFASTYAAHAAFLSNKPHIAFDDTEHAKLELLLYSPFTGYIVTPKSFKKDFGKKQIRFDSFMELSYLHQNYFKPNPEIRKKLGVEENEKYVILRFISWGAVHDIGHSGIPDDKRSSSIQLLNTHGYRVFISSEKELTAEYEDLKLNTSLSDIHHVLAEADLFIGESGTMSTEAALLGTPSFYINSLDAGVFQEEERLGILYSFRTYEQGLKKLKEHLLYSNNLKAIHQRRSAQVRLKKDNVTELMVELTHKVLKRNI